MRCEQYSNSSHCCKLVNEHSFCNVRKGFILVGMEEGVWAEKKPPSVPEALFPSSQASKASLCRGRNMFT